MNANLKYTSSREQDARLALARVAAAGRVTADRLAREARKAEDRKVELAASAEGQFLSLETDEAWCFICSRATDHWGEHTPEQVQAWKARTSR